MNLIIRKAEAKDIQEIQRLYQQLDGHHANLLPAVFQPVEGDARENIVIKRCLDQDDADYLMAEMDGQMVGFVNVKQASYPEYPMFRLHEFAMIDNAVVDKSYRGKGIGTILFHAALAWAKDRDLKHVQTNVWHENVEAREFYLKKGFRPITVMLELDIKEDKESAI